MTVKTVEQIQEAARAANRLAKAENKAREKSMAWKHKISNAWSVMYTDAAEGDVKFCHLVHPETREEAEQEMERLGVSGELMSRQDVMQHPVYKYRRLRDRKILMKEEVVNAAKSKLPPHLSFEFLFQLYAVNPQSVDPEHRAILDRCGEVCGQIDAASELNLESIVTDI